MRISNVSRNGRKQNCTGRKEIRMPGRRVKGQKIEVERGTS